MMTAVREVALEQLLGRVVRSPAGRRVGRIEDVQAEPEGDDYVIRKVVIGELGWRARLLGMAAQLPTFRFLGLKGPYRRRAVPWNWIDWSDWEHPRFAGPSSAEENDG
jgi:sporulation protein YlmC with PRC-barrel domain